MEDAKTFVVAKYEDLCNFMERKTIGTEAVIYGTSGLMLLVAYAKRKPAYLVRPFKRPSHIPDTLINERVVHTGLIRDVQQRDQDTLLLVSHRPLVPIFMSSKRVLPVKLPGVRVNGNGFSWLQACLVGRQATFLPLSKRAADDYAICQLCLVHPPRGKRLWDVSETLLKLRFARFVEDADGSAPKNAQYYKHLAKVEARAKLKNAWMAWFSQHPWFWGALYDLKARLLPKKRLLPELVR